MPVFLVNASRVGRDFSSSDTSMYSVQLDQLTTFSVSDGSLEKEAVLAGAEPVTPAPPLAGLLPDEPQAARKAAALTPAAPIIAERRDTSPRIRAARRCGLSASKLLSFISLTPGDSGGPVGAGIGVLVCGAACAAPVLRLDVGHHVLDAGVVLEAIHRQVLAITAVLEAPVRHLCNDWDVGIDPHAAEV